MYAGIELLSHGRPVPVRQARWRRLLQQGQYAVSKRSTIFRRFTRPRTIAQTDTAASSQNHPRAALGVETFHSLLQKRVRHLPTVGIETLSPRAACWICLPSRHARTIRARSTVRASPVRLLLATTRVALTSAEQSNATACRGISRTF